MALAATLRRHPMPSLGRWFNKLILPFAGTPLVPLYGVITHHGRRSGKTYRTPVVVRPAADGFIIPMPWGEGTDWYRNVNAAGHCQLRWKNRTYTLVEPRVLDAESASQYFSAAQRKGIARFGIKQMLQLRTA
jgi:deazaflavin-dependent oxidoreductase (nitroreductase family)